MASANCEMAQMFTDSGEDDSGDEEAAEEV